ncbi:MAG: ubiquinone biosynthesis regulatory protein kinase UbiB [Arenicella sp.]|nr:ubiquinone biosynthesis regulatory protein kinase UbiB [Arenicella sp.]
MQNNRTSIIRLRQIRRVIRKYELVSLLDDLALSKKARMAVRLLFGSATLADDVRGARIRQALEELGPVFVKFGQALSTRPDLLPADIALELTKLQDEVPPIEGEQAIDTIRAAYNNEFDEIFESVDSHPMASASVAQVHAATLRQGNALEGKNGKKNPQVVVKVLRPGIEKTIESDLGIMYLMAGLLQKHWARGEQFKPLEVIREYDHTIHDELDLRTEAANCAQMGANFADTDIIYVPRVYWDYTHKNVTVMERIYGTSIREFDKLREQGHDLARLANDGVEVFFKQAFEDNFFHADMHPGNIFVSAEGKWIAVDFGIMGTLNDQDKQYLGEMLLGFFNRDYRSIADAHLRAEWIPVDTRVEEFETAIRTVCEPIFAKPISEISFGNVLLQLFQTVRRFEIPVQPQLVLLYKTLLNIEGLGRQLYPQLNLWDSAKPFLEEWMKQQHSPQALLNDLKRDWPQWRALLPKVPQMLEALAEGSSGEHRAELVALRSQLRVQQRRNLRQLFHQLLGFGLAGTGLLIYLLVESSVIAPSAVSAIAPWVGGSGLIWAYFKSR